MNAKRYFPLLLVIVGGVSQTLAAEPLPPHDETNGLRNSRLVDDSIDSRELNQSTCFYSENSTNPPSIMITFGPIGDDNFSRVIIKKRANENGLSFWKEIRNSQEQVSTSAKQFAIGVDDLIISIKRPILKSGETGKTNGTYQLGNAKEAAITCTRSKNDSHVTASRKMGSSCGLTDDFDKSWRKRSSIKLHELNSEQIEDLPLSTRQQIIIAAKAMMQEEHPVELSTTAKAIKFLKSESENGYVELKYLSHNGLKYAHVVHYPGGNPYGVLFNNGSKRILALEEDGTLYCR